VFGAFVKAAQGEGWHYGQTVVLVDTDFTAEREREAILRLRDRVDGLVICSPRLDADTVLELCGRVPSVLVNREAAGADCIVADASDGLRQAVDYLGALGHRRVAYVQGSARSWSNAQRVALVEELAGKAGIGVQVLGSQDETVAGTTDDLDPLLAAADVIVVSTPLTDQTRGLIGARQLARMRPSAVLVNVGRGPVVDEEALYTALRDGTIGGAAVDVWYAYPAEGNTAAPSAFPFHALPNVFLTPHSSGLTRQTFEGRAADIAANIRRLDAGEPLRNVVAVAP